MDVNSALRLASAAGMLDRSTGIMHSGDSKVDAKTGVRTSIDYSSNSMVNQAIIESIKTNAKMNPTTYSGTSSSTANHYGVCGANALLEIFHDVKKGDICRIKGSHEFYCPLGCRIATLTTSVLCAENTPQQEPCRHKVVQGAFVHKKK
jgi:hypothetical protein